MGPTALKYLLNKEKERKKDSAEECGREDATRLWCTVYTIIKCQYLCPSMIDDLL